MTTIINGSSPSVTFSDGTTQSTAFLTGATVTSSGTDITLTSSSNPVQQVAMTAQNLRVILPNATTFLSAGNKFTITNNGAYPFDIAETAGGRLFVLSPSQTTQISLTNISAASTGWVATPVKSPSTFQGQMIGSTDLITYNPTDIASAAASGVYNNPNTDSNHSSMRCCALSSTSVLVAYIAPTTFYPTAVVGTISGTTITWGTPTTIVATAYGTVFLAPLSSTTAIMFYSNAANGGGVKGLAISGTTITASTAASTTSVSCVYPLTSTTAIFGNTDTATARAQVVTYNGASAPTFGAAVGINSFTGSGASLVPFIIPLSATAYVAMTIDDLTSVTYFRAGSISGTTITQGTIVATTNMKFSNPTGFALSTTQALFLTANGIQTLVTVSGTTISLQSPLIYGPSTLSYDSLIKITNNQNLSNITGVDVAGNIAYYGPTIAKLSSTDALIVGNGLSNGTNMGVQRVFYNTTTLGVGKGFSITANMAMTRDICPLTSTTAFVCGIRSDVGSPATLYPTGQVVALNG